MAEKLKRTQLYDWHRKHGDLVEFVGWEMPVRFTDIREEHMAVRDAVGIFDTSNMSRFIIKGLQAREFLQTLTTNNVSKLKVNRGHYTTCLNDNAGMHDDLMLYRVEDDEYIWVTNAANGPKIHAHLMKHSKDFEVEVEDKSRDITMIAVQGPMAMSLLNKLTVQDLSEYGRFTCNHVKLAGYDCYLCRTGYTGEDGAEILVLDTPSTEEGKRRAIGFWEELLKQGENLGVKPCGLGARDSTRLEAGLVLYGHELNEETSPLEARIPYAVKFKVDPHYIGYDELKRQKTEGVEKTRIGIVMIDRGIPRDPYPVLLRGEPIGEVTSGVMSPLLRKGIGLAYVKPGLVSNGDIVEVDIKGRLRKAEVAGWPFYDSEKYGASRSV
ncbi:MAG: glycine cleavage system aminomethyltransferase GcvT [Candidatus Thorarchaeota archaeon]|nr:MAG: glycine cleavage system aminomethyltransferase GcvT [Candidatus Thorarchaeota archaeon]